MDVTDYKAIIKMIKDRYKLEHVKGILHGVLRVATEDDDIKIDNFITIMKECE